LGFLITQLSNAAFFSGRSIEAFPEALFDRFSGQTRLKGKTKVRIKIYIMFPFLI